MGGACVITEPTAGALVTANAGSLTFRIPVPGLATHGSTRDAGVSAIDAYAPIARALAALEARRNRSPDPLFAEYKTADPWLKDHPAVVAWPGGAFASGRLHQDHPLRDLVGDAHADTTRTPRPLERGAPYGSDMRLYSAAGIPSITYGPGDVRLAHGANERVSGSEIIAVTRTLVVAVLRALK